MSKSISELAFNSAGALLCSAALFGPACGMFSVDGSYTKNAVAAAAAAAGPEPAEAQGSDGSTYSFAGRGKLCFTGTIDNRDARAKDDLFRVRLFAEAGGDPIRELSDAPVKMVKEHTVGQPGVMTTNQFVVGPDGRAGQILELGEVQYPVADVEICFPGEVDAATRVVVLNRVQSAGDRSAPSYAAWTLPAP